MLPPCVLIKWVKNDLHGLPKATDILSIKFLHNITLGSFNKQEGNGPIDLRQKKGR